MEIAEAPRASSRVRTALRYLAAESVALLVLLAVLAVLHAATSIPLLVLAMVVVGVLLTVFGVGAVVVGVFYSWVAYPQHRRAVVFIVGLTAATLLAHGYIIGNPPAYTHSTAVGNVGTTFSDGTVNITTQVTGSQLFLSVTAQSHFDGSGAQTCCTVADLALDNSSGVLRGTGFAAPPTLAAPITPGVTAYGTWTLTGPLPNIALHYVTPSCYSTANREYGCIMDEIFYVPEAMGILSGQQCTTGAYAPTNCHMEHPPLTPTMIAAGMAVFGEYNALGWRIFPALLGSFSIPLLFGIAWKLSKSKAIASVSALLLALDVMFFAQSGAAVLDIPEVFFGLAAFLVYFMELKWWKFDKYVLAGILFGVAGLAKETAVFMLLAFLTYVLLFEKRALAWKAYSSLKVVLVVGLVFAAGLQAYDSTLAAQGVPTFVQQIGYILSYGSSLIAHTTACQPASGYWCKFAGQPGGPAILPTDWVLFYDPVGYYVTTASYVVIGYYGITNLVETWTVFVWIPLVAFELFRYFRSKRPSAQAKLEEFQESGGPPPPPPEMPPETRFGAFALLLFAWTYVPYIALFLFGRVTYPFYFIPAIPAVAMGASWWATRNYFPRWLLAVYLVAVFGFFLTFFPDKSFLPVWLRVFLRH